MTWFKKVRNAIEREMKEHRSSFAVYCILRFLVIVTFVLQLLNRNFESAFICVLTLVLLITPGIIQATFKIEFPSLLEIVLLLFVFAAEILGEIHEFYIIFPNWDTILHTLNGFLMAGIGFSLVNLLNDSDKMMVKLSPFFVAVVGFCFSMTIGVVWEIFEYSMDMLFQFDMQKDTIIQQISTVTLDPTGGNTPVVINGINEVMVNGKELGLGGYLDIGLLDTMEDLIVNLIGAIVFSTIGYFYLKTRHKKGLIFGLIPMRRTSEQKVDKQQHTML